MVPTGRAFMRENHEIDQMPVFGDAKMETGTARRRRIYLTAPRTVIVGQDLDVDEVAGFDTWFEVSLKAGTEYFSAEVSNLGPGLLWWKARWLEPYTAEFLGGRWWKVTGKLMLFGEPSTTPPQPSALAGGVLFDLTGEASALAGQPLTGGVTFALLSATGVSIVGGVGFALLTGTYIPPPSVGMAAGTSTAAAIVAVAFCVGSAAGTSSASAVGIQPSVGSAAGVGVAFGIRLLPASLQTGEFFSVHIRSPAAQTYKIIVKAAHGGTITEVTTICESGTGTLTTKINTTALGGTANSVSSSQQSQAQSSANVFAAGDDIQLTFSSLSSLVGVSATIKYTRVYSP